MEMCVLQGGVHLSALVRVSTNRRLNPNSHFTGFRDTPYNEDAISGHPIVLCPASNYQQYHHTCRANFWAATNTIQCRPTRVSPPLLRNFTHSLRS